MNEQVPWLSEICSPMEGTRQRPRKRFVVKRILFVDDEARILDGLRRSLRNMRGPWEMVFAEGAGAALQECASRPFDVGVADARMPGLEGAELLGQVRELYPDTVRIILSGQCSRNSVL